MLFVLFNNALLAAQDQMEEFVWKMNLPEYKNTATAADKIGVISQHLPEYTEESHTYSVRKCGT